MMKVTAESKGSLECPSGGVWDYISPSRLNLWLKCPLAFRLRYIDGIRSPTTPSLFLGKRVHEGLEVYYRHRQLGMTLDPQDVTQQLLTRWAEAVAEDEMQFGSANEEASLKRQAVDLVTAYLKQLPAAEPRPLAVETTLETPLIDPVSGEHLGIPLLGVVDLVVDLKDGPLIADFKTAARSTAPLEVTHEVQLTSYAYLFRQVTGQTEAGLQIRSLIKTKVPKIEFHK